MPRNARPALICVVLSFFLTASLAAQATVYYLKGDPADQANKVVNDTASSTIGTATYNRLVTSPLLHSSPH